MKCAGATSQYANPHARPLMPGRWRSGIDPRIDVPLVARRRVGLPMLARRHRPRARRGAPRCAANNAQSRGNFRFRAGGSRTNSRDFRPFRGLFAAKPRLCDFAAQRLPNRWARGRESPSWAMSPTALNVLVTGTSRAVPIFPEISLAASVSSGVLSNGNRSAAAGTAASAHGAPLSVLARLAAISALTK